jgi:hypothetical protein
VGEPLRDRRLREPAHTRPTRYSQYVVLGVSLDSRCHHTSSKFNIWCFGMPNLFSTYSTAENRVTGSLLAVFRALTLDRLERLLGSIVHTEPHICLDEAPLGGANNLGLDFRREVARTLRMHFDATEMRCCGLKCSTANGPATGKSPELIPPTYRTCGKTCTPMYTAPPGALPRSTPSAGCRLAVAPCG